jgi:hypothetical protein
MTALSPDARATIKASGITTTRYVREFYETNRWRGDSCGCPDDRCIGHHHDADDACCCLPAALREITR